MQIPEQLKERIEAIVSELGFVTFDLKLVSSHLAKTLKVLIDAPCGGITIKQCADVNHKLSDLLQAEDSILERYIVEVSSPGMDWPLRQIRDFQRVIGRKIHLYLQPKANPPLAGNQFKQERSELEGILTDVRGDSLILQVGKDHLEIKIDNIKKAKERY